MHALSSTLINTRIPTGFGCLATALSRCCLRRPVHIGPRRHAHKSAVEKLVILGSGWGAFPLLKTLSPHRYQVTVVSPRDYFLCTPLLTGAVVGTLSMERPITPLRNVLQRLNAKHILGYAKDIDFVRKRVVCANSVNEQVDDVTYDKLLIAVGQQTNAIDVPGAPQHCYVLQDAKDARGLRFALLSQFEKACQVAVFAEERTRLLRFAVIGGGPKGMEFAAQLHDMVSEDLALIYPHLVSQTRITVVEAEDNVLSGFDRELSIFASNRFRRRGLVVMTGVKVNEVKEHQLILDGGQRIPFGLAVWAAGTVPHTFIKELPVTLDSMGRIITDASLRIPTVEGVYAIGDCACIKDLELPRTAQVAGQQGTYLAKKILNHPGTTRPPPFAFKDRGQMIYVGGYKAMHQLATSERRLSGFWAWAMWRSFYLSNILSVHSRVGIIKDWFRTFFFGRRIGKYQE